MNSSSEENSESGDTNVITLAEATVVAGGKRRNVIVSPQAVSPFRKSKLVDKLAQLGMNSPEDVDTLEGVLNEYCELVGNCYLHTVAFFGGTACCTVIAHRASSTAYRLSEQLESITSEDLEKALSIAFKIKFNGRDIDRSSFICYLPHSQLPSLKLDKGMLLAMSFEIIEDVKSFLVAYSPDLILRNSHQVWLYELANEIIKLIERTDVPKLGEILLHTLGIGRIECDPSPSVLAQKIQFELSNLDLDNGRHETSPLCSQEDSDFGDTSVITLAEETVHPAGKRRNVIVSPQAVSKFRLSKLVDKLGQLQIDSPMEVEVLESVLDKYCELVGNCYLHTVAFFGSTACCTVIAHRSSSAAYRVSEQLETVTCADLEKALNRAAKISFNGLDIDRSSFICYLPHSQLPSLKIDKGMLLVLSFEPVETVKSFLVAYTPDHILRNNHQVWLYELADEIVKLVARARVPELREILLHALGVGRIDDALSPRELAHKIQFELASIEIKNGSQHN